jgi:hypothetical protein
MGLFDVFKIKPKYAPPSYAAVVSIMVTLEVDGEPSLFVLLTKNGTVNRMGTGNDQSPDTNMFIGVTDPSVFNRVLKRSVPVIDQWIGRFDSPDIEGQSCKLVLGFKNLDGTELLSQWAYGSQSIGPPSVVSAIVLESLHATERWYIQQKQVVRG